MTTPQRSTAKAIVYAVDHWMMHGTTTRTAEIGMIIALSPTQFEHPQPWRIIDIKEGSTEDENWCELTLRPLATPSLINEEADIHLGWRTKTWETITKQVQALDEHYPICGHCHHLLPCPTQTEEARLTLNLHHLNNYNTPNVCPACHEAITEDQKHVTFNTNIHGFTPVTFHLQAGCRQRAYEYDEEHHAHTNEPKILHCDGYLYDHNVQGHPRRYWCQNPACKGYDLKHQQTVHIYDIGDVPRSYTEIFHTAY